MSENIPQEVKEFLRKHINSVGQLEILFLLYKNPERDWSPKELSLELRTNQSLAERQLQELSRSSLVLIDDQGRGRCCTEQEQVDLVGRLVAFYNLRRAVVIEFIYSQPLEHIRSFADAFKIKKD